MIRHIATSTITAIIVSIICIFLFYDNTNAEKLTSDDDFLNAIESKLQIEENTISNSNIDIDASSNNNEVESKAEKGEKGDVGKPGLNGIQGPMGTMGPAGSTGPSGLLSSSVAALLYSPINKTLLLDNNYNIPTKEQIDNWNDAYGWGNHDSIGYIHAAGLLGGQELIGGTNANDTLLLQGNSATSGNIETSPSVQIKTGNSGLINALTVLNNGNVGINTTSPTDKFTVFGDIGISTNGTDSIAPFRFIQLTGFEDNPLIDDFAGSTYSVDDWQAAVVGFRNGGSCGVSWNSDDRGFQYWWTNNAGNWRLHIDINVPDDGCNQVQVMFIRKELSERINYGF